MKTCLLLLALVLVSASVAHAEDWKTYLNERFGYSLLYPSSAKPSPPVQNGAGKSFITPDEEFSLQVQGGFLGESTLDRYYKDSLLHYGDSITYKVKKKDWYVVSGVLKGGGEFYYKVSVKGGNWASFLIKYHHSKNKKFDPYVAKIAKSFKPFLEGEFDRAPK